MNDLAGKILVKYDGNVVPFILSLRMSSPQFSKEPSHLKLEMEGMEEMEEAPTLHPLFHLSHFSP